MVTVDNYELRRLLNGVKDKDLEITRLGEESKRKDVEMALLREKLEKKDIEVSQLMEDMEAKDVELAQMLEEIKSKEIELTELTEALEGKNVEVKRSMEEWRVKEANWKALVAEANDTVAHAKKNDIFIAKITEDYKILEFNFKNLLNAYEKKLGQVIVTGNRGELQHVNVSTHSFHPSFSTIVFSSR